MEENEKVEDRLVTPEDMPVFRTEGVYQRLHLCDYLRELPEMPIERTEK